MYESVSELDLKIHNKLVFILLDKSHLTSYIHFCYQLHNWKSKSTFSGQVYNLALKKFTTECSVKILTVTLLSLEMIWARKKPVKNLEQGNAIDKQDANIWSMWLPYFELLIDLGALCLFDSYRGIRFISKEASNILHKRDALLDVKKKTNSALTYTEPEFSTGTLFSLETLRN